MLRRIILGILCVSSLLLGADEVVFETSEGKIVFALKPDIASLAC